MASHMGVRRVALADICPGLDDTLIVGIIIASQSAKMINSKKGKKSHNGFHDCSSVLSFCFYVEDMSQRGVWNFTLRDSPADHVNVTVWGSPAFIESCVEEFHVGDVGKSMLNRKLNTSVNFMPYTLHNSIDSFSNKGKNNFPCHWRN